MYEPDAAPALAATGIGLSVLGYQLSLSVVIAVVIGVVLVGVLLVRIGYRRGS